MFHCTIQVRSGLEQDPQVFEGLHTFNNVTFKHKLLAWVSKIERHDFCFFTFIVSLSSTQNCWNVSNYCCSPTFDFDIRARSSAKSNSHTCTSVRAGALHFLLSKRPSRASKYSPNKRGLRGRPCFTPC
jgi:hypothetical protein